MNCEISGIIKKMCDHHHHHNRNHECNYKYNIKKRRENVLTDIEKKNVDNNR